MLKDSGFTKQFVFLNNTKVQAGTCMCLLRMVHVRAYCAWYMHVPLRLSHHERNGDIVH